MSDICRSFTLFRYHIPVQPDIRSSFPYITLGSWDGMDTRNINNFPGCFNGIWEHNKSLIQENHSDYSFMTLYGFMSEDWFDVRDCEFWNAESDKKYPLIFLVFLQLSEYKNNIEEMCKSFSNIISEEIEEKLGKALLYVTVGKNDLIVCLRSKNYNKSVKAIQKLHNIESIVYSYTAFCISKQILESLDDYSYLKNDFIDSIILSGVGNTFTNGNTMDLKSKYYTYANKLFDKIYTDNPGEKPCLYDSLGENDFAIHAQQICLWSLLKELKPAGLLNIRNPDVQFYLYSLNLSLNMYTGKYNKVPDKIKKSSLKKMKETFKTDESKELEDRVMGLIKISEYKSQIVLCAVLQLVKSLQVLERAPVKKFDYISLYSVLNVFISILKEKSENQKLESFCNSHGVYDVINKINNTLHGSLRSDIQFLQTRDYHVIGQYAPVRMQVFYNLWTIKLSDFYNSFTGRENSYGYIFSTGIYPEISVTQNIDEYESNYRLNVITVPEKELYDYKKMLLVMAHEVPHKVGYILRNREKRHYIWLKTSVRVFILEYCRYIAIAFHDSEYSIIVEVLKDEKVLEEELYNKLTVCEELEPFPHSYHSRNSKIAIQKMYNVVGKNEIEIMLDRDIIRLSRKLKRYIKNKNYEDKDEVINKVYNRLFDEVQYYVKILYRDYINDCLQYIIDIIYRVTSEAFADLMAILTLNINPQDYVESFIENQEHYSKLFTGEKQPYLLYIRMIFVISTLEEYVCQHSDQCYKGWERGVIGRLLHLSNTNTPGEKDFNDIVNNLYRIKNSDKDFLLNIEKYQGTYIPGEGFKSRIYDFFNDTEIRKNIQDYLQTCADSFHSGLNKPRFGNFSISDERKEFESYYHEIKDGTNISVIQTIERFLSNYEKSRYKSK